MPHDSPAELLVLHAVRLSGLADDHRVARRFGLDPGSTAEQLLDFQAYGWVTWSEFAGLGGWSLTEAGRLRGERLLADELDGAGARPGVRQVHADFLPHNDRLQRACTNWQLRPTDADPLAPNQHDDSTWDAEVIDDLVGLASALQELQDRLVGQLTRFAGYHGRFAGALDRVREGDPRWVNRVGEDSCHSVWMELHEDLIASLGLQRGPG